MKVSQGVLLVSSVVLSAVTFGASVQSCAYKRDMLPVRTHPLDFSCRAKSDFSAKSENTITLCMASVLKHSSQIALASAGCNSGSASAVSGKCHYVNAAFYC